MRGEFYPQFEEFFAIFFLSFWKIILFCFVLLCLFEGDDDDDDGADVGCAIHGGIGCLKFAHAGCSRLGF